MISPGFLCFLNSTLIIFWDSDLPALGLLFIESTSSKLGTVCAAVHPIDSSWFLGSNCLRSQISVKCFLPFIPGFWNVIDYVERLRFN